jgi:hypothetical protein
MPMQPDREIINSWVGLTIDFEDIGSVTLRKLLAIGSEQVVYQVVGIGEKEIPKVVKFPRNHIGFVLDLPPNGVFRLYGTSHDGKTIVLTEEEYKKEQKYNSSLSQRLRSLRGSPLLVEISPLDLVWMRLANALMDAVNYSNWALQSSPKKTRRHFPFRRSSLKNPEHAPEDDSRIALLSKYSTLLRCKFIRNVLVEWSSADTGSSETNTPDLFLAISAADRPILVDIPSLLVRKATKTLQKLDALLDQLAAPETTYKVENNPFLPYVTALITGYNLSEKFASEITEMLRYGGLETYLQQLRQLLHVVGNDADFLGRGISVSPVLDADDKTAILNLLTQVMKEMPLEEWREGMNVAGYFEM